MNNISTPNSFAVPGLGPKVQVEPTDFLQFLRTLINDRLGEDNPTIKAENRFDWITIADGLIDHFLVPLPQPGITTWVALQERMELIDATLECISRMFKRVEDIYDGTNDYIKKLVVRLLDLCSLLDAWIDAATPCDEDIFSPEHIKQSAFGLLVALLRGLDDNTVLGPPQQIRSRNLLHDILMECLNVCSDLSTPAIPATSTATISFFGVPRVTEFRPEDQLTEPQKAPLNVVLSISRTPSILSLIIDLAVNVLSPSLKCHWFLFDVLRMVAEVSRNVYNYYLNPLFLISAATRVTFLVKLVLSTAPLRTLTEVRNLLNYLPENLLQLRMDSSCTLEWENVNTLFANTLKQEKHLPPSRPLLNIISQKLEGKQSVGDGLKIVIWSYFWCLLPQADDDLLSELKSYAEQMDGGSDQVSFLEEISSRLGKVYKSHQQPTQPLSSDGGRLNVPLHIWRRHVQDLVGEIIAPDTLDWMDDDEGSSVPELCRRSLFEIQSRLERPGAISLPPESRLFIASQLVKLDCLFEHCDQKRCSEVVLKDTSLSIQAYVPLISPLLGGPDENLTPDVRMTVFRALSCLMKHHSTDAPPDFLVNIIFVGLCHSDRSVRITAGYSVDSLIRSFSPLGARASSDIDSVFARFYQLFEVSRNNIRETLLTTIGLLGRTTNTEVLQQVICLLIAQLGKQNLVIKGLASMQVLAVAKFHNKSPYALTQPYMHKIAPYIMSHTSTQPHLLNETCQLLSINPADFFSRTLSSTLPRLFASCDEKALKFVADELSDTPPKLFVKHSAKILAHIFALPNQASMNKGLNFTTQILTAATGSTVGLQNACKMCLVPLIAELVIVTGDDDPDVSKQGIVALRRIDSVMATGKLTPVNQDLGSFLKVHMLGVISDINDMLRDVHGRKSVKEKRQILRSLGVMVRHIGPPTYSVAPQIMATFQTMVSISELSEVTLSSWHTFLTTLGPNEIGAQVGPTSAAIVSSWSTLPEPAREIAFRCLDYIITDMGRHLNQHLGDIVDLSTVPDLRPLYKLLSKRRGSVPVEEELQRILEQSSNDNLTVAMQALGELKSFMLSDRRHYIRKLASGDMFDPMIGQILNALLAAACRDGDGTENLRLLSFECIGVIGAVDPDRCEIPFRNTTMVVLKNFTDEGEAVLFSLHLIQDLLVGVFRSTSDMKYQTEIAYSIQELLKFCQFTPALVAAGPTTSIPMKIRNKWNALPKHVVETVAPLLEGRFNLTKGPTGHYQHPIYPTQSTYREWVQAWTSHLISKASGPIAQKIFGVFRAAVRNKDVVIARHLLPHLVLNILVSGNEGDASAIRTELLSVLEDQEAHDSNSTSDKKLLSAQAVFMLLDHLNKWVRIVRQDIGTKKAENKRARPNQISSPLEAQLLRLDSMLSSIDQSLMAKAALQCKAYARSLMNFEQQILAIQARGGDQSALPGYYEKLHEIYAHLDEPDGMEGISTLILSPSLEHQIRQHESTGRWTSAQSCWEVRLQQSPHNVEFHLGLLRCVRNLGHYDTLRTHVRGVLTRHPEWESTLADFSVESAWMVGAWDDVQTLVERLKIPSSSMVVARLLLNFRKGDPESISESLLVARSVLGAPITAAGAKGYRHSYEAVLGLHLTHELELIHQATRGLPPGSQDLNRQERRNLLAQLAETLSGRLDATLPTFRSREPILSMRRTAFALCKNTRNGLELEIGRSWLASAKIARKAKQWQTAYSAMLQAQQSNSPFSFVESAKLVKAAGEPLRALQELENSIKLLRLFDKELLDLTTDAETERMKAKILVLRARWMNESDRFDMNTIFSIFQEATVLQKTWESAHYYLGQFHDECFKALSHADQMKRGQKMNVYTVRSFSRAIMHGSKFVYQTVPRILTIWLDAGEDPQTASSDAFKKMTENVSRAFRDAPVYKWFTAFPQIVSRVGHSNPEVYAYLSQLIVTVMDAYPKQTLWLFMSVVKSTKLNREHRGKQILDKLKNNPTNNRTQVSNLIDQSLKMTDELLGLCDAFVDEHKTTLSMTKDFGKLKALGHSDLIIPLQESLTASLPPTPSSESGHQPFQINTPTFHEFYDEIEVMRSLAKPRKITIRGSNGQTYMFLGKPKDDLRKDARLMDLNAIINKLLKGNSESRRRQLHIRTYGVVALNEECGFIQWVPNTIPIRPVLLKYYDTRRIKSWSGEMADAFKKIKDIGDKDAAELFRQKILPLYPPVFHEWFLETFPEPTEWLASRLTYGRTAAVMSMVGFILGLGDRHCENILLDTNSGDVVHVDFNCLFEKGKSLETPERVPFRLTQNIIDGLGVSGVEGVFRTACEVTMQLLRDNKDSLMSVLDAFIHDPLVEWEDEKRKLDRAPARRSTTSKSTVNMRALAKTALSPIEKKLKGIYSTSRERHEKEITTSNLVQMLIAEATDLANLAKMYPGWAPWH